MNRVLYREPAIPRESLDTLIIAVASQREKTMWNPTKCALQAMVLVALWLPAVCNAASDLRIVLGDYSATSTADAQVGTTTVDLAVIPVGQSLSVDTCDASQGTTYLRIFDDSNTQIAAGSGGCPSGGGTKLSITSPGTRSYYVRAGCVGSSACSGRVSASSAVSVVKRWAPVLFQDTFPGTFFVPGDYITNFNFDGDYDGTNNWNNVDLPGAVLKAHVYYSHVETLTHHFIGYYFHHPQDRTTPPA